MATYPLPPNPLDPPSSEEDAVAASPSPSLRFRGTASSAEPSSTGKDGVARSNDASATTSSARSVLKRIIMSSRSDAASSASTDLSLDGLPESPTASGFTWQDADYCLYFELVNGAQDDKAHGIVDAAATLLRDVGCHVRVFPLKDYDAEIPADSRDETRAYVVTVCSAFITMSPTKSAMKGVASAVMATSFAPTAAVLWAHALPPWITQLPAFKLVAPLAGAARSQQLTRLILKEFRLEKDVHLGDGTLVFNTDQRLLHELLRYDDALRLQVFPLHRDSDRDRLVASWNENVRLSLPLAGIFQYFGPKLAMYFTWLEFYTEMLVPPAVIGIFVYLLHQFQAQSYSLLALVLSVYTSIFVDRWQRRQREVEYQWKYRELMETDAVLDLETRPQFRGEWLKDAVSGKDVYDFPHRKRFRRQLLAIPLIVVMCGLVAAYVVALNMLSEYLRGAYPVCSLKNQSSELMLQQGVDMHTCISIKHGPGVLNAVIILIMDNLYQKLARRLNEYENYRTVAEFEEHLVLKRMPFHFVNSNASLLYLAFYVQDLDRVRERLYILMVLMQIVDNFKELGLPYIASLSAKLLTTEGKRRPSTFHPNPLRFLYLNTYGDNLHTRTDYLQRVLTQKRQAHYVDTFADYKEMMVQYGYVALYTPIYPLAPFCAWFNNIIELRTDFYKLANSNGFQRPLVQHTHGIGVWEHVLVTLSVIAVVVNCAFVWTFEVKQLLPEWSDLHRFMLLVACEHFVFVVKALLNWASPDVPTWIQNEKRLKSLTSTHAQLLSPRHKQLHEHSHGHW